MFKNINPINSYTKSHLLHSYDQSIDIFIVTILKNKKTFRIWLKQGAERHFCFSLFCTLIVISDDRFIEVVDNLHLSLSFRRSLQFSTFLRLKYVLLAKAYFVKIFTSYFYTDWARVFLWNEWYWRMQRK